MRQFAAALKSLGVKKGDRVGLMLPNCPHVVSYYAALLGAVLYKFLHFILKLRSVRWSLTRVCDGLSRSDVR